MNSITVKIPKKGQSYITLYAEGTLISQLDKGKYYQLEMASNKCLILFYNFNIKHRRLYVVCKPELMNNKFINTFELVSEKLSVVAHLRGRGFDQFKRSLEYMKKATDKKVMDLPPAFWWQFAYLCNKELNNHVNLNRLLLNYNLGVKKVEWK